MKPLDNIECRKAIIYAMNPTSYQNAYGGKFAGGEIATTMLPPMIPGYKDFDLYGVKDNLKGQPDKAKEALKKCGQPDGFEINMGYRSERPPEKATAEAFQEALGKVGIKVTPKPFPDGDYFSALCRQAGLRGEEQARPVHQWMGSGLERRVRLPLADRGQPRDPADRRFPRTSRSASPRWTRCSTRPRSEQDNAKREAMWGEIDKRVMEEAVTYPGVYAKVVLVRSENRPTCSSTSPSATTTTPRWV